MKSSDHVGPLRGGPNALHALCLLASMVVLCGSSEAQPPELLKDINVAFGSSPTSVTSVNGTAYFAADDGVNGIELWKSDGTAAGTVLVKNIRSGATGSNPASLTNVNGTLFFKANDGVNGIELWKSDGTAAGTVLGIESIA